MDVVTSGASMYCSHGTRLVAVAEVSLQRPVAHMVLRVYFGSDLFSQIEPSSQLAVGEREHDEHMQPSL